MLRATALSGIEPTPVMHRTRFCGFLCLDALSVHAGYMEAIKICSDPDAPGTRHTNKEERRARLQDLQSRKCCYMWNLDVDEPAIALFIKFCGFADSDHYEFVDYESCVSRRMELNGLKKCKLFVKGKLDAKLAENASKRKAAALDMTHLCDYEFWVTTVIIPFFRILNEPPPSPQTHLPVYWDQLIAAEKEIIHQLHIWCADGASSLWGSMISASANSIVSLTTA